LFLCSLKYTANALLIAFDKSTIFGDESKNQYVLKEKAISEREVEVLTYYSKGLTYNQIAEEMAISPSTVRKHIENIYKKLQVHNKMEAVQKGLALELI
jgi:DNA-binding NarL/FixJ family response regulator